MLTNATTNIRIYNWLSSFLGHFRLMNDRDRSWQKVDRRQSDHGVVRKKID